MSIAQKLEINYKNQIKNIKKEKNRESKMRQISAIILDLGENSINVVAKYCNCCWRYAKKCYLIVKDNLQINSK